MEPAPTDTVSPRRAPGFPWLAVVIGLGILISLYIIFWITPSERQMGVVYKIFYFHVSSAMSALLLFFGSALLSAGYLALRAVKGYELLALRADRLAASMAEIGVLFGIIVLVTGPLWAKPAWGTYWTWEPRLTLTLLTVFLFVGYLVLRGYSAGDETGRRLSAGIAVIGAPATLLIHVAVTMWGGNHPQVITGKGGGLADPNMRLAFGITTAAVFLLVGYLVDGRYRYHAMRDAIEDLFLDLSDLEEQR